MGSCRGPRVTRTEGRTTYEHTLAALLACSDIRLGDTDCPGPRGVALTGLRRWAPAPSSWTSIADAIRVQSLLWCVVLGLYVARERGRA